MKEHPDLVACLLRGRSQREGQTRKNSQVRSEVGLEQMIILISAEVSTSGVDVFHAKNIRL